MLSIVFYPGRGFSRLTFGWATPCRSAVICRMPAALLLLGSLAYADTQDSSYDRAASAYRSGDCAQAVELVKTSTNPKSKLLLGRCYLEVGRVAEGIESLRAYTLAAPADPVAALLLSGAEERRGNRDSAIAVLESFMKGNPLYTGMRVALADVYATTGQYAEARKQLLLAAEKHPDDPAVYIGSGLIAMSQEQWGDAIRAFEKALTLSPNNLRSLSGIGMSYVRLGDCEKASAALSAAVQLAPDDFRLAKSLGLCYARLQKWPAVLSALQTGTPDEATDEEATATVVTAFQHTGDTIGLERYCRGLIAMNPSNVHARVALGDMYYQTKKFSEARSEYLFAVKKQPDLPSVNEKLGDIARAEGAEHMAEARQFYFAATRGKSANDVTRMKLAQTCFDLNDADCTEESLAMIQAPSMAHDVKMLRLQTAQKTKKWDGAASLAGELLAENGRDFVVLCIAAEAAEQTKRDTEAADLFERALAVQPKDKVVRYHLASLYSSPSLNKVQRAVDLLSEYLHKYEQDSEGYLLLGNAYRKLKDLENARLNFRHGFDKVTPPVPPSLSWAYGSYGVMLAEERRYDEAYSYQTIAVQLNPDDPFAQYNLANLCQKLGKVEEFEKARAKLAALNSPLLQELGNDNAGQRGSPKKSR